MWATGLCIPYNMAGLASGLPMSGVFEALPTCWKAERFDIPIPNPTASENFACRRLWLGPTVFSSRCARLCSELELCLFGVEVPREVVGEDVG